MRTREQIIADCEAAYERLRAEAKSPHRLRPCETCAHCQESYYNRCHHPLIKGFGDAPFVDLFDGSFDRNAKLCGPERALWEPRQTCLRRLLDWFAGMVSRKRQPA